ncbi:hypothetical protein [Shewanella maritima]|uniref:hypothetical protein n=1 Tax=Shewanella maritima TaxID=2520507 RepID=UPI00373585AD
MDTQGIWKLPNISRQYWQQMLYRTIRVKLLNSILIKLQIFLLMPAIYHSPAYANDGLPSQLVGVWQTADSQVNTLCIFADNTYVWIQQPDSNSASITVTKQNNDPRLEWGSIRQAQAETSIHSTLQQIALTLSPSYYSLTQHPRLVTLQSTTYTLKIEANNTSLKMEQYTYLKQSQDWVSITPWSQLPTADFGLRLLLPHQFIAFEIDFEHSSYLRLNQKNYIYRQSNLTGQ